MNDKTVIIPLNFKKINAAGNKSVFIQKNLLSIEESSPKKEKKLPSKKMSAPRKMNKPDYNKHMKFAESQFSYGILIGLIIGVLISSIF